jgi:hypothetical protein
MPERRVGWQPSPFLADRAEAERAFALAEQLGSVHAAAQELGTTWPSLRKAFTRHGLGLPARNPEAVRSRASAAARQRTDLPLYRPWIRCLWCSTWAPSPARERPAAELYEWVRRDEKYAMLAANVVVEMNSESRARWPTSCAWRPSAAPIAPTSAQATAGSAASAGRSTGPAAPTGPAGHLPKSRNARWWAAPADRLELAGDPPSFPTRRGAHPASVAKPIGAGQCPSRGVERPRRVVRFARLIHRRGRVLGGPTVRAACGGDPSRPGCHAGWQRACAVILPNIATTTRPPGLRGLDSRSSHQTDNLQDGAACTAGCTDTCLREHGIFRRLLYA